MTCASMTAPPLRWLFSPRQDVLLFGGSALASLLLVAVGRGFGVGAVTPLWAWVLLVVGIDVAHVWSTLFRVYLDGDEVRRRPGLYWSAPLLAYVLGVLAYQASALTFWRVLAYVAVWHFVRQQVGWMALYGRRSGSAPRELRFDAAVIYAATLGPVLWWHAHLPRPFEWFVEGDFLEGLPEGVGSLALVLDGALLGAWLSLQVARAARRQRVHPGKLLLVVCTWVVWFGGIVLATNDFAFTAMNVVLHGVPYLALSFRYARGRQQDDGGYSGLGRLVRYGLPAFLTALLALAWLEEFAWDTLVWHERPSLFSAGGFELGPPLLALVVPLLALPQTTHYLLDGFVWRSKENPLLARRLGWAAEAATPARPS
jgi:hypothetical protein